MKILNVIYARIGTVRSQEVNYQWTEDWIFKMETELNLAQGTMSAR